MAAELSDAHEIFDFFGVPLREGLVENDVFDSGVAEYVLKEVLVPRAMGMEDGPVAGIGPEHLPLAVCILASTGISLDPMLKEPDDSTQDYADLHRRLGDYTLFWAGMFPESLRRTFRDRSFGPVVPGSSDPVQLFAAQGSESYGNAADMVAHGQQISGYDGDPSVFRQLSSEYAGCLAAIGHVREVAFHPGLVSPDEIYGMLE